MRNSSRSACVAVIFRSPGNTSFVKSGEFVLDAAPLDRFSVQVSPNEFFSVTDPPLTAVAAVSVTAKARLSWER